MAMELTAKAFHQQAVLNHEAYEGKTVVIKFGGEIYDDKPALDDLLSQVRMLQVFGARVVLVHGGAKQIDSLYKDLGIEPTKVNGERQCDKLALDLSYRALTTVNEDIIAKYNAIGGRFRAETLSDEDILMARPKTEGLFTGEIDDKDVSTLNIKLGLKKDPTRIYVVHPICSDGKGGVLNVNADYVAAALAKSLGAKRLIMCTNTPGILDDDKELISHISPTRIEELIDAGVINGGMIPKVKALIDAVKKGVEGAVILNPALLSTELFTTQGAGTLIQRHAHVSHHLPPPPPAA